jgi:hypothetical protein
MTQIIKNFIVLNIYRLKECNVFEISKRKYSSLFDGF